MHVTVFTSEKSSVVVDKAAFVDEIWLVMTNMFNDS